MTIDLLDARRGEYSSKSGLVYSIGDPYAIDESLKLRLQYVEAMDWQPAYLEGQDPYDKDPRTIHLAKISEGSSSIVEAGMRLTPVDKLGDSLSLEMISSSPDFLRQLSSQVEWMEQIERAAQEGQLWDLTRLVTSFDTTIPPKQKIGSILEMIGAGIALTSDHGEAGVDPLWFFATNRTMKSVFKAVKIQHTVLASGILGNDEQETYFCVARPLEVLDNALSNPRRYGTTIESVERGIRSAHRR